MSALGNSLRRRLALSKDTRFNTFIGGIGDNITTASQLASLLLIPLNTIRNFNIRNNDISCFITDSYTLGAIATSTNQNITGNIWAFIDLQGKVTSTGVSFFIINQSLDRLRFVYLPNAQVGNGAFRNRGFFNRLTIAIQNSVPVGSTTGNDFCFNNAENSGQGSINFRVFTDVINQTNNNGNPDGDIQRLLNQGSEVVYVPSVKVNPPTPTNIQQTQVGGTFAELDFTLPTHVNDYLGYMIFSNGFYIAFIEKITDFYALGLNPSSSNRVELRLVDEFFNISEPARFSVLTPALNSLFENAVAYFKLDETSGNAIDVINGFNGTLFGGVTQGVAGKIGTAYSFDGSSGFIDLGDNDDFSFTDGTNDVPFTIRCWVNPSNTSGLKTLISKWDLEREWELILVNNSLVFSLFSEGTSNRIRAEYSNSIVANQLQHIVVTYDGLGGLNSVKISVDNFFGIMTNSIEGAYIKTKNTNASVLIAKRDNNNPFYFNGSMDEITIIKGEAWDLTKVSDDYNNGNGTTIN